MFEIISNLIFTVGLTLGVGSSTFALTFFIRALEDGVIDSSERRFMHTVYVVLRIGMILISVGLICFALTAGIQGVLAHSVQWILLGVITLNAILMTLKRMPMRFGPILAGGSWYALFIVSATPIAASPIWFLVISYIAFLVFVDMVFNYLRNKFTIIKGQYRGGVSTDESVRITYATDASAFTVKPSAVYYPKNVSDVVELVRRVREAKKTDVTASLTVRAGGTCMSGGPLNTGWIVDMTKHMSSVRINKKKKTATVETGAYFRDIEDAARKHGLMFAAYPSSRRLCGIGGMIGNNASGEKSLRFGATSDNLAELEVVFADGSIKRISPKPMAALGDLRESKILALYEKFGTALQTATGTVKKSASGYRLEKLMSNGIFNEIPLITGAQGTLGIVTKAVLKLTPIPKHLELLVISAGSLTDIPSILETVFEHNPEALETFDNNTLRKAYEHLTVHADKLTPYIDASAHLYILAEFSESTKEATKTQAAECFDTLTKKGYFVRNVTNQKDAASIWEVRRNSFLLMRDYNPDGYRAVPCIEDVIVPLGELGVFIEKLNQILEKHTVHYGFHGHIGDGSLRIIPVFDFTKKDVSNEILALMKDVFALVKSLKGNISADHSDGIIRTPFLKDFYGDELYGVFEEIKKIYDPENIMNPNKKVGGTVANISQYLKN